MVTMLTSNSGPQQGDLSASGLRSRKKLKTRLAIQDAALDLFAEQGFDDTTVEQIAARAEVSTATFFRYFKSKSDTVFGGESDERTVRLPALGRAIVARPPDEDDLTAVRHAVLQEWVPLLEPTRLIRHFQAASASPVLQGLSTNLTVKWQATIRDALAVRHGLDVPDHKCRLAAAMALATFTETVNAWMHEDEPGDLASAIAHGYEVMAQLSVDWSEAGRPRRRRPAPGSPRASSRTRSHR
jgi:AcrR family transcriptional regulator